MRIMTTGAAAALLMASAFGVMALPSSQPVKASSGATLVQNANPQPEMQQPKAKKHSARKSAAHRKAHKSSMQRSSHRYKTSKHASKRTSARAKGAQKMQRPS